MAIATKRSRRRFSVVTANLTPGKVKHSTMGGREYMVVPMVMITKGVHSGNNGPLFYPGRELADLPERWNHKPVVVNHPTDDDGESVSACTPKSVDRFGVGVIMNTRYDATAQKLRAEAWLDEARLKKIAPQVHASILRNKIVEVSTGLFSDNLSKRGTWNGEKYVGVARNYKPDHLAILTDGKGACSVADGAGLLQLNKASEHPEVVEIGGKVYVMPSRKTTNSKKGSKMALTKQKRILNAKKKLVAGLIANKKSGWDDDDKDALMGFKLSKLRDMNDRLAAIAKAAKKKATENAEDEEEEEPVEDDDAANSGEEKPAKKGKAAAGEEKPGDKQTKNKKKLSLDEWLDEHDAPEPLRRVISNSIDFEKKTRTRLIKTILAVNEEKKGPWTEKKLNKMDTEILNDLAATLNGRKAVDDDDDEEDEIDFEGLDFSARGGLDLNESDDDDEEDEDDEEEMYVPPSTFNAKLFNASKK